MVNRGGESDKESLSCHARSEEEDRASAVQPTPVDPVAGREKTLAIIAELRRLRAGHTLGGITIKELIEEGRRF
jgi:hypothetical protein